MNAFRWFACFVLLIVVAVAGCPSNSGTGTGTAKEKIYDIKGKVLSVDAKGKSLKLDHEAIPGYMPAMKMPFDVEDAKLLEGLKEGDQVQGKLRWCQGEKDVITELKKQ